MPVVRMTAVAIDFWGMVEEGTSEYPGIAFGVCKVLSTEVVGGDWKHRFLTISGIAMLATQQGFCQILVETECRWRALGLLLSLRW